MYAYHATHYHNTPWNYHTNNHTNNACPFYHLYRPLQPLGSGATSASLSTYLLDLAKYAGTGGRAGLPSRFAGYAFNDSVGLNVSVNWQWVRAYLRVRMYVCICPCI